MNYYYSSSIKVLDQIEQAERAILEALGCPTTPVGVWSILAGEQPAPWPKRTASRDKQRAKVAMFALRLAQQTRAYLDPLDDTASQAVYWALQAGAWAGDIVIAAEDAALGKRERETQRKRGRKRGVQLTKQATKHDATITRYLRLYQSSDEAQLAYRSAGAFIQRKTALPTHTIQRALKRLKVGTTRVRTGRKSRQ